MCAPGAAVKKDTVLQINLLREIHFAGDGGENETFLPAVGQGELDLSVQTTWTQQSWVQSVSSVGGHNHLEGVKQTLDEHGG